eukprot:4185582-Amphidinium_carterae.1
MPPITISRCESAAYSLRVETRLFSFNCEPCQAVFQVKAAMKLEYTVYHWGAAFAVGLYMQQAVPKQASLANPEVNRCNFPATTCTELHEVDRVAARNQSSVHTPSGRN